MRLLNVGITATQGDYNTAAGVLSVIKNIQLLDGSGKVLDQLRGVGRYSAFKNYNHSNASNKSVNRFLKQNNLGYEVAKYDLTVPPTERKKVQSPFDNPKFEPTLSTTQRGWVDLKELLPILQSALYLPTQVFKNLTLRVEFNSAIGAAQNTTTPLLAVDSMANSDTAMKMVKAFKAIDYVSVENDQVFIGGLSPTVTTPNPTQTERKTFKGFDNKHVNKLVFIKQPSTGSLDLSTNLNNLGSQLYLEESENIRINGRSLLVGSGLDSAAKSLAKLGDVYGTCNAYSNKLQLPNVLGITVGNFLGEQDYRAFLLSEYVSTMEVSFGRTGDRDPAATDAVNASNKINNSLTLHCYAEVNKTLQVQPNGTYLMSYPRMN